jgi:hypothetical protein
MQKFLAALLLCTLLLNGCGTLEISLETTPVGNSALPSLAVATATIEPTLSLQSASEQIRLAMLESASKWKSVWMDGTSTSYAMPGTDFQTTATREQVWIDLPTNRFRVVTGPVEGQAEKYLSSDGTTILEMDLTSGQSQSRPFPEDAKVGQFIPTPQPGYGFPQPLWGQMGTPISQLAFTSDFAQSDGTFKPIAIETIAGREALVVDWTFTQNKLPSWRMWLDTRTGVILKMQTFDKEGGDTVRSEAVVNQVSFDDVFADSLFGIPSSIPQFSDIRGMATAPAEMGTLAPSGRDALGELYFFTLPHKAGNAAQLVRVPGHCAVGEAECPELQVVNPPFPFNFTLNPISWSPDGKLGAFAYPDHENGTPQKLWLFDPEANTWNSLFEYAYIDLPFWSPDGRWLAFRVQDGLGGEDVYAVKRDGSDLKNLTATNKLPAEGRPYVMDGWITGNIIVRSGRPGNEGMVYLLRITDGHVTPMFETLLTKSTFVPSHDGAWIAYDNYDGAGQKHSLMVAEPDGAHAVELTSFSGGTLYPIVWSPDSRRLAFAYYTAATQGQESASVYVIDRGGKGLQQVYKGTTVGNLLFSPDGKYLLVNEISSPTGVSLFTVNLNTLEQRILQSPGLSLDADWSMPSWRP